MKDRDFLIWIHGRLENQCGNSAVADHMRKLRAVIKSTPSMKDTPNTGMSNNLDELLKELEYYDEADFIMMINDCFNREEKLEKWERGVLGTSLAMTDKKIMLSKKQRDCVSKIWQRVAGL